MRQSTTRIGIAGLGLMGQALMRRLLASGVAVLGHDVDDQKMAVCATLGGTPVIDVRDMAGQVDALVLTVFSADQAMTLIRTLSARRPGIGQDTAGSICPPVISLITSSPEDARLMADTVRGAGAVFIEMPISGSSAQFGRNEALGLVAAHTHDVASCNDVLALICAERSFVGDQPGDAACAKLAVNLALGINRAAIAESMALATRLGLDPERFMALLRTSAAYSRVMDSKGPLFVSREFTAPQSRVDQSLKDFTLIQSAGRQAGLAVPFASLYKKMLEDNVAHGEAELDNAVILRAIERAAL
jgi:putative dehydrogenase